MNDEKLCKLLSKAEGVIQTLMLTLEEALTGSGYQV